MRKYLILLFAVGIMFGRFTAAVAEVIKVGLEPFPPLITEDKRGFSVELLREVEKISNLQFQIIMMPYSRAKKDLKNGRIDLMGHTPHERETEEFYAYAQDLDWTIPAKTDVYAITPENLELETLTTLKVIGTPRGNEVFFSELFGIPIENFRTGKIDNLLTMLTKGRIKAFIFERASTMSSIKKMGFKNIAYRLIDDGIPATFSVRTDSKGNDLKKKLDELFRKVDQQSVFHDYFKYTELEDQGVVQIEP